MTKSEIRKLITERKKRLTMEEITERSNVLAGKLFELDEYKNADTVFVYISFNQEVRTAPIIERALNDGKRVAAPRIISCDPFGIKLPLSVQYMEFVYLDENTVWREYKGIREPADGAVADEDALVIVPGLAFGRDLNRIGYGGGFYDRYFACSERELFKVALCYGFQVFDSLEVDGHDVKIDKLISDLP